MSDELEIDWIDKGRLTFESVSDSYNPMQAYMANIQIGMRSDGVIVWRKVKPNPKRFEPDVPSGDNGEQK